MAKKCVYYFVDGKAEGTSNMKELLGGKGVGLAEMTNLGDPKKPLLVSVRSGARASMPGMMDTVLNVGLTLRTVEGLAVKTQNEWFAQDNYPRFVTMFGNMGDTSGTGVAFTRHPNIGEHTFFGECLMNAQGEDVVAGIRTPLRVSTFVTNVPAAYNELEQTYKQLEKHYRDILDLEFAIQEGKLYMLQTRVGKRTGISAVRIAVDVVKKGLVTKREAVQRVSPNQLSRYQYPTFDSKVESSSTPLGKGLPAGLGSVAGKIALTPDRAVEMKAPDRRVVLVLDETSQDDIHSMNTATGFLTARGGMISHAAVVVRQMAKVCVTGCERVQVIDAQSVRISSKAFHEGDYISVNVSTGNAYDGDVPVVKSEAPSHA